MFFGFILTYSRIIKDFCQSEPDLSLRPRVFGMTASPVDSKTDTIEAASELEALLDSRIATTSDMSLSSVVKRPVELTLRYPALPISNIETKLLETLKTRYKHIDIFTKIFVRVGEIARDLGSWCADSYVLDALSQHQLQKYERKMQTDFHAGRRSHGLEELDEVTKQMREAIAWVHKEGAELASQSTLVDVSSKVGILSDYLAMHFERPSNHRCIVFVQQKDSARQLHRLFGATGDSRFQHMRTDFLVGSTDANPENASLTFRQQILTLLKFRKGEVNCLFSTSVAEEGLDIPDCNLVIRFDIHQTMIQYVQSRGRARSHNSKFVQMVEDFNSMHSIRVEEAQYQETVMRKFCQTLPQDRNLIGNQDTLERLLGNEKGLRTYTDPTTGAKLTYGNALVCLANFVSAIPTDSQEPQHPTYIVSTQDKKFIAEVLLPDNAPLLSAIGRVRAKKSLAKRSAAFEACIELRKKSYLDAHLQPIYVKKLPAMRNAMLAKGMKKTNQYVMRVKPNIWAETRGTLPTELWMTLVDFSAGLDRPHQPLLFLTRIRMPQFPSFPVYLNNGHATSVDSVVVEQPLEVTNEIINKLTAFTFRVFNDVFSKKYEEEGCKLSYWLGPAPANMMSLDQSLLPQQLIDWAVLDEVFANPNYQWTPDMSNDFLSNKFFIDIWDGSRKFYSKVVNTSLKPTDPIPDDVGKDRRNGSILNYSVSLWKKARQKAEWNPDQPVVEAEKVLARRNLLAPPNVKEVGLKTRAVLCPEPLRISALPAAVAAACFIWPAIIHRFESYLISMEACARVGVKCSVDVALAALTKDSDHSGDDGNEERVNFQHGMGDNYERLEFIGDTFLKTATTLATFILNPNESEFEFHVRRMLMLCNKNLFRTALTYELYEYIRGMAFSRRLWYPEGLKLLAGKGVKEDEEKHDTFHEVQKQGYSDKTIADVCEALIGAAFITHDQPGAWQPEHWESAIRAVTTFVNSEDHPMLTWDDYKAAYQVPAYQISDTTASQRYLAEKIQQEHPYQFRYPRLLYSAFLHSSIGFIVERVPNYQRLEFLGDALLDMACISYLFHSFPNKDPQWLTEHKMAMVSNRFLGALCVNIGFHKHLRHANAQLEGAIRAYATELAEAKAVAGDNRDYWTTVSDPPKCLPDIVEAFVGAVFIDSDFDYSQVQRFFDMHVRWYFEDTSIYDSFANNHPCTHLYNLLQTSFGCEDYRLMAKEVPSFGGREVEGYDVVAVVMIHGQIIAHSTGKSGRYARLRVANAAIEVLDGLTPAEFRRRFGCTCNAQEGYGLLRTGVADCVV